MKKMFLLLSTFMFVLFMYSAPVSAAYYGQFSSLLGDDYKAIYWAHFIFEQNNDPNIGYKCSKDEKGNNMISCGYTNKDGIKTLETLVFNDDDMAVEYSVLLTFNDYNKLAEKVKEEDDFLHRIGTVYYDNQGGAGSSDWEYVYAYYVCNYNLLIDKKYTPRGEYKASLRFIDNKFDKIESGIY